MLPRGFASHFYFTLRKTGEQNIQKSNRNPRGA
nr:MAG TPA: hypothetical protein [Caudoviricetes sp.]